MAEARVERRLAAILAADVAGYSRLMGVDEEGTLARSRRVAANSPIPRSPSIAAASSRPRATAFWSSSAALWTPRDAPSTFSAPWPSGTPLSPESRRIEFRIGINVGDIIIDEGDIYGDGVNIAARVEALASPGAICLADSVYQQIKGKLAFEASDMGDQKLKNIAHSLRVYRVKPGEGVATQPIAPALALPDKPSIAVLPFQKMSGDPQQEYFADGMVEEIITGLARIRWLTVIARNSTFAYKGKSPDVRKVGRELAVRYVVEGSVRKAGNNVRITAQLIEAETGGHLWAERFDGTLDDVFDLQDKITAGVVAAIEPSVRQAEIERAKRKRPDNLDAYDLYLRALEQSYTFTPAGRSAGLSLLDAAIALDPGYVEAHGVAAFCLQQRYLWGGRAPADREAALRHAEAVANARTDDATALAFAAMALSALAGRHDVALVMIDRALERNPSSAIAHSVSALLNMMLGRPDKAEFHAERSLRLSPFDPLRHMPETTWAAAKLAAHQYEAALVFVRRALEANPVFSPGLTTLALCLVRLGRIEEARATVRRLLEIAPDTRVATLQERYLFANSLGFDHIVADLRLAGLPE